MASEELAWQQRCYQLVDEKAELEQQLAQVREERDEQMHLANRLQSDLHEVIRQRIDFYEQRDQARADCNYFIREAQSYKAQATQARALLEALTKNENDPVYSWREDGGTFGLQCDLCDTEITGQLLEVIDFPHAPECPWLKARAFLAAHPQQ